jgi:hypothetical protein
MKQHYPFSGDFRKSPKTNFFCAICQKDLNKNAKHIEYVFLGDPAEFVTDPKRLEGNEIKVPIGPECAKKIPPEYRVVSQLTFNSLHFKFKL